MALPRPVVFKLGPNWVGIEALSRQMNIRSMNVKYLVRVSPNFNTRICLVCSPIITLVKIYENIVFLSPGFESFSFTIFFSFLF